MHHADSHTGLGVAALGRLPVPAGGGPRVLDHADPRMVQGPDIVKRGGVALVGRALEPVERGGQVLLHAQAVRVHRAQLAERADHPLVGGPAEPDRGLGLVAGHAFAVEIEPAQRELRLAVAQVGRLPQLHRRRDHVPARRLGQQKPQRRHGPDMASGHGAAEPALGLVEIGVHALAETMSLAESEHGFRLTVLGGPGEEAHRARLIPRDPATLEQEQREAQLGVGVAMVGGFLEPARRLLRIGARIPGLRIEHPQTKFAARVLARRRRREPVLGLREIDSQAQAGRAVIASADLGGGFARLGGAQVPRGGLGQVLFDRAAAWKQPAQGAAGFVSGLQSLDRQRRAQALQIDLA